MTTTKWSVYVEGVSDRAFLQCVARHLKLNNIGFKLIGGNVASLKNMAPRIQRSSAAGMGIAVIADANSDVGEQRARLQEVVDQEDIPVKEWFFLPDDARPGCLETLLEDMAVPSHRPIHDCFDHYEECLRRQDSRYALPDAKARIYAYCKVLRIKTRPACRDYRNPHHWNMDAPALQPLKRFLLSLRS